MSSSSLDELRARLERPTPTNHTPYWNRDSVYTFDSLTTKHTHGLHHSLSRSWDGAPLALLLAKSNPNSNVNFDARTYPLIDNEVLLSQRLLGTHIPQSGTVNLDDSDSSYEAALVAGDERSHSPTASTFSDVCSDYEQQSIYDETDIHKDPDPDGGIKFAVAEDKQSVPASLTRPTRIRFRSRVRVGSGISRHRYPSSSAGAQYNRDTLRGLNIGGNVADNHHLPIAPCSISSSPSSSISMPLRSSADDEVDRPGWGPLGRRVSMFANKRRKAKGIPMDLNNEDQEGQMSGKPVGGHMCMNERSPLLYDKSRSRRQGDRRSRTCYCSDPETSSWNKSPEEVEEVFGKWPERMLNYQWWWWQTEGVICCRCLDESEDEYY